MGKVLDDEHAAVLCQAVAWLAQELTEAEVSQARPYGYGQRHPDPGGTAQRLPPAGLEHPGGSIKVVIPKLRAGSYFFHPAPRRRSEQAFVAVV